MKTNAIVFAAALLLAGCQHSDSAQRAQSLSSANQHGTANKRWLADNNYADQSDLWRFISDDLKMPVPDNAQVREQRYYYLQHKRSLQRVALRAEPYMYEIIRQIKNRNMPMELALLPIVESAYNPRATSSAKAAGLWQIVPSTGQHYGLRQDDWYDGRRDVIASTRTALDIMQRLNDLFDGDWLLTIAAYNCGEGCVLKAIQTNQMQNRPTDFWSLSLPQETTNYIPKMLALSSLIKHHRRYGIQLPKFRSERALARVDIGQQVMLSQIAELTGLPLETIRQYNMGYKQGVTAPDGPHYVMLPKSYVPALKKKLAEGSVTIIKPTVQLARRQPVSKTTKPTARALPTHYKVRPGDTLSTIAKRMNVSTRELQQWNKLKGSQLRSGQTLQIAKAAPRVTQKNTGKSAAALKYKVRKGDSLSSIARQHGVKIKDILRWNALAKNKHTIKPGDQITLYTAGR